MNEYTTKYTKYENFINNYFIKEKYKYFEDNSLNYDLVPVNFRTNNFLENYNRYIKIKLGEKRIINWISFLHFIKEEIERSLNKLINNNYLDLNIHFDEITNTNLDLFKTEINTKEHNYLKNDNTLNIEKEVIENKI